MCLCVYVFSPASIGLVDIHATNTYMVSTEAEPFQNHVLFAGTF